MTRQQVRVLTFPTQRHYTIEGYSQRYYKKQAILYKKLSVLNEELINERLEIEDWLEGVKDKHLI